MVLENDEIRRHGVRFSEAWDEFATPLLREEFDAPRPSSEFKVDPNSGLLNSLAGMANHFSTRDHALRIWQERREEIIRQMIRDLYDWLTEDDLVAYGFQLKPTSVRTYRKIPATFWDNAKPDWENDAASDLERHYYKILIIDTDDFPHIDFSPKVGRKSEKQKILHVIRALDSNNAKFRNRMNHKERINLIRNAIKSEYPELDVFGSNFGDDTIRKTITYYLKKPNNNK